jgi:hypothetical protein
MRCEGHLGLSCRIYAEPVIFLMLTGYYSQVRDRRVLDLRLWQRAYLMYAMYIIE